MEEQAATLAHDFMTVYFTQGMTLLGIIYMIFSGQIRKLFNRVSKFKSGNTEVDFTHCHEPERRKAYRRASDGVCAEHKKLEEHIEEIWIEQMKATFYNDNPRLSLADKMYAGLRYVWWGQKTTPIQNGQMKSDVLTLCVNNKDAYQAITKLRPELKLEELEKKYKWPLV